MPSNYYKSMSQIQVDEKMKEKMMLKLMNKKLKSMEFSRKQFHIK